MICEGQFGRGSEVAGAKVLELHNVSKSFPGVQALDSVALVLRSSEIHGIVGENGAGKSTLIKIVAGLFKPDSGTMLLGGNAVSFGSASDAHRAGVSVVHQERSIVPRFSVAENMLLEDLPARARLFIDRRRMNLMAERWLGELDINVELSAPLATLSNAQAQRVEIARALLRESRILILDEPTASITPREADSLFVLLAGLRDRGAAIGFVSHKLEEILRLCDRVTVLRDGRVVAADQDARAMSRDDLVTFMIGHRQLTTDLPLRSPAVDRPILEVRSISSPPAVRDASLTVRAGEIHGLYGLVGAGRSELAKAILGADRMTAGAVFVDGQRVRIRSVSEALRRYRIGYVTENRREEGLFLQLSVKTNITSTVWRRLARLGWVKGRAETETAQRLVERLRIKTSSTRTRVATLSGGNQQKVSLAKWLAATVRILIVDEPTVGIDVQSKAQIHELLSGLADNGMAILLISSDMPEMIGIADRITVMVEGRIAGEVANSRDYDQVSASIMQVIQAGIRAAS